MPCLSYSIHREQANKEISVTMCSATNYVQIGSEALAQSSVALSNYQSSMDQKTSAAQHEIRFRVMDFAKFKPCGRLSKFEPSLPAIEEVDEEEICETTPRATAEAPAPSKSGDTVMMREAFST